MTTALLLVGCGQDAPPYDDLPLRDALRATPEVVASLSLDTRRELALRLDAAGIEQEATSAFDRPETVTIDSLARIADEAREDQGNDALIVGELISQANDFVLHGENVEERALGQTNVGPIYLQGRPGAQTAALEDLALQGRAGKWLRELSGRTKTSKMVRKSGVPFGAWAFEDTLYVNPSWLVAMSALEEGAALPSPGNGSTWAVKEPPKTPLSVDYNPYKLPDSVSECAIQVQDTCKCGTSCTHEVTDPSFPDANAECAWVNQDASHPTALCVLALMSIDDLRQCMEYGAPQCSSVSTGDDALAFVTSTDCMNALDTCLRDGYIPRPSTGSNCNSCNNCDGCSGCSNSSSGGNPGCADDIAKCNNSCASCNNNWADCNNNCSDSGKNCADSKTNADNCGKCSVKPPGQSPLPAPVGNAFWLIAPVAYLMLRGRRRS